MTNERLKKIICDVAVKLANYNDNLSIWVMNEVCTTEELESLGLWDWRMEEKKE